MRAAKAQDRSAPPGSPPSWCYGTTILRGPAEAGGAPGCLKVIPGEYPASVRRVSRESPRLPQPVWLMELGIVSSADRVTCCNRCTFTASTRLGLLHVPPAPTVSLRWHHGRAPVQSPCGSRNMLRLQSLRADSCTLGATMKVCDLFAQPLTVLLAVVSHARLHPLATRE
jgi:hypothetical protein